MADEQTIEPGQQDSGIEPEKKDPNTSVVALKRASKFRDGGYREWNWDMLPLSEQVMWNLGRKILGLNDSEAIQNQNVIADIMKLTLEHLQTEDELAIGKFIRTELRHTPNSGSRLYNLLQNLIQLREEKEDE